MSNEPRCDNCGSTSVYRREETFWDTQKKSWSDGGYEFICLDCGQYDVQLEIRKKFTSLVTKQGL